MNIAIIFYHYCCLQGIHAWEGMQCLKVEVWDCPTSHTKGCNIMWSFCPESTFPIQSSVLNITLFYIILKFFTLNVTQNKVFNRTNVKNKYIYICIYICIASFFHLLAKQIHLLARWRSLWQMLRLLFNRGATIITKKKVPNSYFNYSWNIRPCLKHIS